jgi:hypothetical protein
MEKVLQGGRGMVFSFLLCAGILTSLALAQLPTATILGVVRDSSGAVVPDTALTARNVETGQTRTAISAVDGSYRFSALAVGAYQVRAEHAGFQAEERSGLTLTIGQEAVVNFALQVGAVSQTVAVTAEAPMVNTTSGSLGGLVNEQRMSDLPLNGRNYADLTLLQPGVTQLKNYPTTTAGYFGVLYSSNGASFQSNSYLLDGASIVSAWGYSASTVTSTSLGVDGIREYQVITNSFKAEYGMTMGSQMVLVSKGGSNQFHGDAFEYLRNSALDARNFFDYPSVATKPGFRLPPFKRNDFGGSFGGPLKKDKTFFYGVYEEVQARTGITTNSPVLGPGCHGAAGAVITKAACPQLGTVASVTIAPQIAPYLAIYPIPNLPNNQFTYPYTQPETDYYGQMRVDHTFSSNDTLFGRFTVQDSAITFTNNFPGIVNAQASRGSYSTLSETHIFSPSVVNTARFSYSRSPVHQDSPFPYTGPQYALIPGQPYGEVTIGGVAVLQPGNIVPLFISQNLFTWSDDVYYTRGRHSLKFGFLLNHYQQRYSSSSNLRGGLTFTNIASFLQAQASSVTADLPGSVLYHWYHSNAYGFYAQDDLRVSSRLTLNVGLRYEPMSQIDESTGRGSSLQDVQHDAAVTPGPPVFVNPSLRNFSPRFGFAWDVKGDGKTAVRGGFGLLYDVNQWGHALAVDLSGEAGAKRLTITNPGVITIPLTLPQTPNSTSLSQPDYHMQQPHLLQYNLTVERQLPFSMAVNLGYAGSRGINIVMSLEGNPVVPQGIPLNGVCVPLPSGQTYNINGPSCWTAGNPRTNPHFGTITLNTAGGDSFYNALQIGLTKRLSRGLQFQSSYTYSKVIDDTRGLSSAAFFSGSPAPSDPVHRNVDRAVANFDTTQNWRFNSIYNLPQSSLSGAAGKLLNGWWMSGILSLQNGYPLNPELSSNRSLDGNLGGANIDRPNLVQGFTPSSIVSGTTGAGCLGVAPNLPLGTPNLYYNPCAFSIQPAGFLGNAGRNMLRGPGLLNLDFSVVKDTAIKRLGESGRLQFRAEVFNILNHANFAAPLSPIVFAGVQAVEAPVSTAGLITTTANNARQVQFALKLLF